MSPAGATQLARVAVVGGGLAGLAAAVALCQSDVQVDLFESRRRLGGRAGSFRDPATGEWIDHCQHVGMGCCTNLADFCRRTGIDGLFRRDARLHFFGPDGGRYDFAAASWLPAPLHLGPALWSLGYLSRRERAGIGRAMLKLARTNCDRTDDSATIGEWLQAHGQSPGACRDFWGLVLVSALGETLDRAALKYARQVFVEGFMAHRRGWELEVPRVPLGTIYGERLADWLEKHCVRLRLSTAVEELTGDAGGVESVRLSGGEAERFDAVILAAPWRHVRGMLSPGLTTALPELDRLQQIEPAPITAVHLWFDRPVTELPHAVLVGRLSQWLFNRGAAGNDLAVEQEEGTIAPSGHYYQVVVSASRELAGRDRAEIAGQVHDELAEVFPAARTAKLSHWRVVTAPEAVFSVRPGIDRLRPTQRTAVSNLALAGDWTDTGWPATMEGAVRSGYLAAEALLSATGRTQQVLQPGLPRGPCARWLLAGR